MPINQNDRIAFSLYEVTAPAKIKGILTAQAAIAAQIVKAQSLDTANDNLFLPSNTLINQYQNEFKYIDGNVRSTTIEQDILDSANRKLGNHFFPNDTTQSVPSLSSIGNVWPYVSPFGLSFSVGLNYVQVYPSTITPYENLLITTIQGYDGMTDPSIVTATVNQYVTLLGLEDAAILAIVDPNPTNTANNTAAHNNIQSVILPALNTYLSFGVLITLQTAVTNRAIFLVTRTSQLNTVLGTVTQNLTNGNVISTTGLYGQRYNFLALRLNALNGSLTTLASLQLAFNAQTGIIANINSTTATYKSILPTSAFQANANGTSMVSLVDVSFLSQGDAVYVVADNQIELQRAVKSISGNAVVLNDVIPPKYTISNNVRIYKDLT